MIKTLHSKFAFKRSFSIHERNLTIAYGNLPEITFQHKPENKIFLGEYISNFQC